MDPLFGPSVSTMSFTDDIVVILESSVYLGLIIDHQPIYLSLVVRLVLTWTKMLEIVGTGTNILVHMEV